MYQDKLDKDIVSNYFDKEKLNTLEPIKYSSTMSLNEFVFRLCEDVKNENIDSLIEFDEKIENESLSSGEAEEQIENMLFSYSDAEPSYNDAEIENPYAFLENQSFTWKFVSPIYNSPNDNIYFISTSNDNNYGPVLSKRALEDFKRDCKKPKFVI